MTCIEMPGVAIVPAPGPLFPAAQNTATPALTAASQVTCKMSLTPACAVPPRLRLITCTPCSYNHSIPSAIADAEPEPCESRPLALYILALGATPRYRPLDRLPSPIAIVATCVPWPLPSKSPTFPARRRTPG